MERTERNANLINRLKYFGAVPGLIIYFATEQAFGEFPAILLGAFFAGAFAVICDLGAKRTISEIITLDINEVLTAKGVSGTVFEMRYLKNKIYLRVYLVKPTVDPRFLNMVIFGKIDESWYRKHIGAAQVVQVEREADIRGTSAILDRELLDLLRGKKEK